MTGLGGSPYLAVIDGRVSRSICFLGDIKVCGDAAGMRCVCDMAVEQTPVPSRPSRLNGHERLSHGVDFRDGKQRLHRDDELEETSLVENFVCWLWLE